MQTPFIITNFKIYRESCGANALKLAKIHEKVTKETNVNLAVAVSALDLKAIASEVSIPVLGQHADSDNYGARTGKIIPEMLYAAGAFGTLLNHAENRITDLSTLEKHIFRAKEAGLVTIVCAKDLAEAVSIAAFDPDYIAIEPPELIGGDVSISTANPEIIAEACKKLPKGKLVVGAGVKTGKDTEIAISLGARGILLASGVVKAENPEQVLNDLVRPLRAM